MKKSEGGTVSRLLRRYFIDATSAMALGLFSSLIIGLIISQMAKLPPLGFLKGLTGVLGASSPVVGAAIGAAIAYGLKCDAMVMFSCAGCSAIGYAAGGPVGAYISALVGCELGQIVSKKTPVDIIVTPMATIIAGGLAGMWVGPYVSHFMNWLGAIVNTATAFAPLPMGVIVGIVVGMVLTLPISSAALCVMLGISGLAAGAATAGCAAQMVGFALISFGDNGVSGLISQGLGTSMLQVPNIMRKPVIWLAPIIASGICGGVSTTVFQMTSLAEGAGMGTSGLVGQLVMLSHMAPEHGTVAVILTMLFVHVALPGIICLAVDRAMRHAGWVKKGDMSIRNI